MIKLRSLKYMVPSTYAMRGGLTIQVFKKVVMTAFDKALGEWAKITLENGSMSNVRNLQVMKNAWPTPLSRGISIIHMPDSISFLGVYLQLENLTMGH